CLTEFKVQSIAILSLLHSPCCLASTGPLQDVTSLCGSCCPVFHSISLSRGSTFQDTLRVLTLWFDYRHWPKINKALVEGIKTIQTDTWISHAHFRFCFYCYVHCDKSTRKGIIPKGKVIPQLIAHIDTASSTSCSLTLYATTPSL
uniref:Secreted protein n=1 Tax=Hucho hucho TaxID=62062 RepID=A0A4W5QU77_9TELE